MLTSPFQQPSPRQNLLAGQIHEASGRGDEHQLLLLQTQWVHRFGVETLPVATSHAVVSHPQEQVAGYSGDADVIEDQRVEETFLATVEPDNDSEPIDQQEESEAASPFERFTSLLSETVDERSEIEGREDAQDCGSDPVEQPACTRALRLCLNPKAPKP